MCFTVTDSFVGGTLADAFVLRSGAHVRVRTGVARSPDHGVDETEIRYVIQPACPVLRVAGRVVPGSDVPCCDRAPHEAARQVTGPADWTV
ncbi:hypothetical protein GCM10022403_084770 [Streptomyces coacervatus]|uniref:Uncharacterized protein n=1 Tax=Streptomyces coacervatus TaxID=647381 RepID=A0ABP7JAQ9_9ACTN